MPRVVWTTTSLLPHAYVDDRLRCGVLVDLFGFVWKLLNALLLSVALRLG